MLIMLTANSARLDPSLIEIGRTHESGQFALYIELERTLENSRKGVAHISAENVHDAAEWYEWPIVGAVDRGFSIYALATLTLPTDKIWYLCVEALSGEYAERMIYT